jgi:hypothetical protein
MKRRIENIEFAEEEKKERLHAALRGARLAGHVPMKAKEKLKVKKAARKAKKKPG